MLRSLDSISRFRSHASMNLLSTSLSTTAKLTRARARFNGFFMMVAPPAEHVSLLRCAILPGFSRVPPRSNPLRPSRGLPAMLRRRDSEWRRPLSVFRAC
eukprot:scaffold494_cov245-Pinguiococcus_pyrenoidosus.AAC.4